jgi:uncharacterized membrane protein (DUF485 family)
MKKAKILIFILVFSFIFFIPFEKEVLAATSWEGQIGMGEIGQAYGEDVGNVQDIRVRIVKIINISLTILGILTVVLIMYAGFQWMTAGGNENQVSKAKSMLKNAVIGLVIILMAWSITSFILVRLQAISEESIYYTDPILK